MINRKSVCLFALLCVLTTGVRATAQDDILTVTSRGVGITESDAKKDALINAMQQAIGAYLDSETLIENDQIIRDKILAVSDGFVKEYDATDGPTKRPDGLYEVTIKAQVQRGEVQERLKAIRVIQGSVAGKDAAAEVLTKIENAENGKQLLEKHFDGLLEKLLVARLVGEDGKPSEQVRPIVEIQEDGRIKCTWNIEVYFDMKAFYEQVVPQLDKVFRAVSEGQPGSCVRMGEQTKNPLATGYPVILQKQIQGRTPYAENDSDLSPISLSIGRDQYGSNERFRIYLLSRLFYSKALAEIEQRISSIELHVYALDDQSGVVREEIIPLSYLAHPDATRYYPEFLSIATDAYNTQKTGLIIAPRFAYRGGPYRRLYYYTDVLIIPYGFMIEQSDLEKISGVRFRFAK